MPKIAAVQMNSTTAVGPNLLTAKMLVQKAVDEEGAELIVLPENFALMAKDPKDVLLVKESLGRGRIQDFLSELSASMGVWIIAGTIPITSPEEQKVYASTLVLNEYGERIAAYNKLHLFDVHFPDTGETYQESALFVPGQDLAVIDTPVGRIGLSICYDVRFPMMYRAMRSQGAEIFVLPSAFLEKTGRAHWQPLLRARAIENQAYMVAPNQSGLHDSGRQTYGNSMIINPWGDIIAQQAFGIGVITAEISRMLTDAIRAEFPVWQHRRTDLLDHD
jgi:nitrilase